MMGAAPISPSGTSKKTPDDKAFVLGGGGKWGAVEVGMIRALEEADIKPDLILGTSIGAFNGAVIADCPDLEGVERLTSFWEEVTARLADTEEPFDDPDAY